MGNDHPLSPIDIDSRRPSIETSAEAIARHIAAAQAHASLAIAIATSVPIGSRVAH